MDKERRWILIVKLIENITFPCLKLHVVPYFASHLGSAEICEFMSWKNPSGQAYWSVWTSRWQLRMCFSVTVNRYHHLQGKKDSTTDLFVVFQMFLCNKPSPALGFLYIVKCLMEQQRGLKLMRFLIPYLFKENERWRRDSLWCS